MAPGAPPGDDESAPPPRLFSLLWGELNFWVIFALLQSYDFWTGTAGAVSAPNIDLPPERVVRGFPAITLHAPHEALPADTKFYQKEIRGRCNGRKSHDLILKFDSGVARIQGDRTQRRSQRTREELERADWVCIFVDVSSVLSFHCSSFAACDAEDAFEEEYVFGDFSELAVGPPGQPPTEGHPRGPPSEWLTRNTAVHLQLGGMQDASILNACGRSEEQANRGAQEERDEFEPNEV
ncbi:hypothetical protein AK812_SmicGene25587 [Symbiodinium microadriaticum]|uniref:Uncharacterized protein n=1 Tax=Symbiodinium microadriaticum TaxID=2951 RepID=A0A1Q9DBW4_SYMMI|nr:hypothetical protein AK812_SmicGene25587 [Symbiodinium microadriaticum]